MVSARTGGLAVALGIGYAVATANGVASADTTDTGSSGSDASSSSSAGATGTPTGATASDAKAATSSSATSSSTTSSSTSTADTASADAADAKPAKARKGGGTDKTDTADKTDKQDKTDKPEKADNTEKTEKSDKAEESEKTDKTEESEKPAETSVETSAATAAADTESVAAVAESTSESTPESTPEPTPDPVSVEPSSTVATVEQETAAGALPKDDEPSAPIDSLALFSVAAAARRDLTQVPAAQTSAAVTTSAVSAAEPLAAAPPVVAIDQVPPLGFLQQIPILGPGIVTPIVSLLHQIPIAGDIVHPFVGYPVQWGLPPGAPQPRDVKVVSFDGTQIYVHYMPASGLTQGQKAPTVLNGPGLGATGATNLDGTFLDPILADTVGMLSPGTLRRAGYNVVTWDPRGEWNSGGTLELNSAEYEARDMAAIISWIATQPEAQLDGPGDPRLGMVGVSYGGGIQLVTAATDSRVDAIVPTIAYNRLDTSLYKNGAFKTSWATPLTAVLQLLGGRINPRILPATIQGDLTGELSQSDLDLFLSRNPDISKIKVPTLIINGTVDTLFSLAEADATAKTLLANGVTTKVVFFCGGHGICANNLLDMSDGVLIQKQTLAWLDRYVKQDPNAITGPQFEWVDQRGQWFSAEKYPVTPGTPIVATSVGQSALPLIPYLGGSGFPFVPYAIGAVNAVNLKAPDATATTYLVGAPKLTFNYSGTGSASHVYAQLVDNTTGTVLGTIVTPVPVTLDGTVREASVDLEPIAHTLRPGESVTLQIVSAAGLYETIVPSFGNLSVTDIRLSLPTADPALVTPFTVTA